LKQVRIYSDGACEGNPGPGGWAAILTHGKFEREISGGEAATTNNRMELSAAIHALAALNQKCKIDFYTDSQYLRKGISEWVHGWKRKGWRTSTKEPVRNADLWKELDRLASGHELTWHWVKGHSGDAMNERCDVLAVSEIAKLKKQFTRAELKAALAEFRSAQEVPKAATLF
jgi:ribonuclease HI